MNFRVGLVAVCFAAQMGLSLISCKSKCSSLSDTCVKCADAQTKQGCTTIVNAGDNDGCDAENLLLSGFCK